MKKMTLKWMMLCGVLITHTALSYNLDDMNDPYNMDKPNSTTSFKSTHNTQIENGLGNFSIEIYYLIYPVPEEIIIHQSILKLVRIKLIETDSFCSLDNIKLDIQELPNNKDFNFKVNYTCDFMTTLEGGA